MVALVYVIQNNFKPDFSQSGLGTKMFTIKMRLPNDKMSQSMILSQKNGINYIKIVIVRPEYTTFTSDQTIIIHEQIKIS